MALGAGNRPKSRLEREFLTRLDRSTNTSASLGYPGSCKTASRLILRAPAPTRSMPGSPARPGRRNGGSRVRFARRRVRKDPACLPASNLDPAPGLDLTSDVPRTPAGPRQPQPPSRAPASLKLLEPPYRPLSVTMLSAPSLRPKLEPAGTSAGPTNA